MSKELENKIIQLIDHYIEHGITVHLDGGERNELIELYHHFGDSLEICGLKEALDNIGVSIDDHGNQLMKAMDIDHVGDRDMVVDEMNYPALGHPLSSIAYMLSRILGLESPYDHGSYPIQIQRVDKNDK